MKKVEVLVIGGGPAGLCAALSAGASGAEVLLVERSHGLGGQLSKQTHMFFGSEKQYAGMRGIDILSKLLTDLESLSNVTIKTQTTVLSIYEDGVITMMSQGSYEKVQPDRVIVATGASEKSLGFINNDLPGIYGAGAVQTLMNIHGVKPGSRVLMVGAGNIGLIVSYQLMQAGVEVVAILDAAQKIGGYLVHASKIRRMGVPILTGHTVVKAHGETCVEQATIASLDEKWQVITGSETTIDVDSICISVGLSPLSELLFQAGCRMKMVPVFGGFVPLRDDSLKTSIDQIYIAGDVGGVEEASSAMVEGHLAGICAARSIGKVHEKFQELYMDYQDQLRALRSGHSGDHIRQGMKKVSLEVTVC